MPIIISPCTCVCQSTHIVPSPQKSSIWSLYIRQTTKAMHVQTLHYTVNLGMSISYVNEWFEHNHPIHSKSITISQNNRIDCFVIYYIFDHILYNPTKSISCRFIGWKWYGKMLVFCCAVLGQCIVNFYARDNTLALKAIKKYVIPIVFGTFSFPL